MNSRVISPLTLPSLAQIKAPEPKSYGEFFVIINSDGTLGCDSNGHPYVFKEMGPHDNHSKYGRRIGRVVIIEVARVKLIEKDPPTLSIHRQEKKRGRPRKR